MKLKHFVMQVAAVAAIATAVPTAAQAQLWYNGDFDNANAVSSERNTAVTQSMIYDNFVVTGAGWTINSVFGNFLSDVAWTAADYEIRSGVSAGSGGALLFSGTGASTPVATGRSGFGFNEYTATISGLSIFLNPGTYWLGISPVGSGTGRAFASVTSGASSVNAPLVSGNSFLTSSFYGKIFDNSQYGSYDFSYGVDGASRGQEVVPEPATMTLLATGLAGMAAARRRKAAKA